MTFLAFGSFRSLLRAGFSCIMVVFFAMRKQGVQTIQLDGYGVCMWRLMNHHRLELTTEKDDIGVA